MAISNFHGTDPLVAHAPVVIDLQQWRGFDAIKHFDGQELVSQDVGVVQARARAFIGLLEQNLSSSKEDKPALGTLLDRILHLSESEQDANQLVQIKEAFIKQRGYFSRLFSEESWEEWTEHRTALGRVVSQMSDCIESHTQVDSFTKRLDEEIVRKANQEACALLKKLAHRNAVRGRSFRSEISCTKGLVLGTFGSLLTQRPLPFLMGLSGCFPTVSAQQKVGSEFQVNNYTTNNQQFPSVASFPSGNFVVTWESYGQDGSGYGIYGQLFDANSSKIGREFQVNTVTPDDQFRSSVTGLRNGTFVVTWSNRVASKGILSQIFNGIGAKIGSEFSVNMRFNENHYYPSVASWSTGNFVVSWVVGSAPYVGRCQICNGTGAKIGSEFGFASRAINVPSPIQVLILNNGNFIVTWQSQDNFGLGVYGQLFDENGTKVNGEFRINSYGINDQMRPTIADFNNGNFVVSWESSWQDGDLLGVYGQLFNGQGKKVGNEFRINTEIINDQGSPSVASLSNNHFIVVWRSGGAQDGSSWGVFGQLFDENGAKIGNEFQINTHTTDSQSDPSLASLNNGNFVVIWNSNLQDGSGFGIYGQIFHDNFTCLTRLKIESQRG